MAVITPAILAVASVDRVVIDLLVILSVAGVIALVMQRMRMALVPAYLIAGTLIGPDALGLVSSQESIQEVTRLAIILLLFGIGLELDVTLLRRGLGRMLLAGVGSVAACVCAGWAAGRGFGLSGPAALAMSMALSMSSTAVVLRIMSERRELLRRSGRISFAILILQDILVLGVLALLPALADTVAPGGAALPLADGALGALGAEATFGGRALLRLVGVAALVIVAKVLLPHALRESLRGQRLEVMMLVGLGAALGAAVAAQAIGFSLEMGAFLAGFVLAGTPFRHQLSGQIGPLRDIFAAIFFTTVGMRVDPAVVADGWWVIALGVVIMVVLKALIIGGMCWAIGAMTSTCLVVGLYLAQAGEFSLVLVHTASDLGLLSEQVTDRAVAMIVVSLVITPGLAEVGRRLARLPFGTGHAPWIRSDLLDEQGGHGEAPGPDLKHVVIGGFGPVGRRVAEELERLGVSCTVVELNPDTVREQLRRRRSIVFGDVANLRVLESAGIARADALILTVPDEDAVLRACAMARRRTPSIFIAARTGLAARGKAASRSGADVVVVDEVAAAEAMARVVAARMGAPAPPAPVPAPATPTRQNTLH